VDFTATLGSDELDPVRSTNVDLFADYYLGRLGVVSGGVFYKRMENNVYRFNFTLPGASIPGASDPGLYDVNQFRNADGADVYGVEVGFERDLSFLPSPFDGLGVFTNYTYIDSDVDTGLPERVGLTTPLFGQVEQSANFGMTYQKGGFQSRVAYTWRDAYLDFNGINADPNLDRYRAAYGVFDVTASYAFKFGLTVFTEFRNLLDSADRGYSGDASLRPNFSEYRDWSATLGVRAKF
jgi:TonB-dependent receptor